MNKENMFAKKRLRIKIENAARKELFNKKFALPKILSPNDIIWLERLEKQKKDQGIDHG